MCMDCPKSKLATQQPVFQLKVASTRQNLQNRVFLTGKTWEMQSQLRILIASKNYKVPDKAEQWY